MTLDQFLWLIAAVIFGVICMAFAIGYQCGKEDTTDPVTWHRTPEKNPYREEVDDKFDRLMAAWLSEDPDPDDAPYRETALLEPPLGKQLATTGELRALAYAGDMDAIRAGTAQFISDLDKETGQ